MKHKSFKKQNKKWTTEELAKGILASNSIILSQTITLLESTKEEDNKIAREVIELILPKTGNSIRIGITGVPGVGKSTFIEAIGQEILKENTGNKIAVLAIDPSSQKSKGSILGDKTRMEKISVLKNVFIRPSPAGKELGGVHRKTRETILLCEAAGYNYILVETVGVGQSETAVHSMVDCFLLLMLPGAGDELQGIKRGIMEMADIIAINKADSDKDIAANTAVSNYKNAIHLLPKSDSGWITEVTSCSALNNFKINLILDNIIKFKQYQTIKGYWIKRRNQQSKYWIKKTIEQYLINSFFENDNLLQQIEVKEEEVLKGNISSFKAAEELIEIYKKNLKTND